MAFNPSNLLRKFFYPSLSKLRVQYGSALFIGGHKATETCVIVSPHIDINSCLKNIALIEDNVTKRKRHHNCANLKENMEFYSTIHEIKETLQDRKTVISDTLRDLYASDADKSHNEIEKLKIHYKIVQEDLKNLKAALWPVEEDIMIQLLALPNALHTKTPLIENLEIFSFNNSIKREFLPVNHLDIAAESDLLTFINPSNYYFKNGAALFELNSKFFFSERLRNFGFFQFSNADFTKSVVVEGCGFDHRNPDEVFILHHNENTNVNENNRLHLVGGGSLFSFAAYHTRNVLYSSALPLKYFSLGRQYKPVPEDSTLGLFKVSQSSVVEIFIVVKDCEDELDAELENTINNVTEIYKMLGYPFRVTNVAADKISNWESMRISFEMFSVSLNKYVEVGNISVSDKFISQRLQIVYKDKKEEFFPRIISGTILSVPKLIGCVLELDPKFQNPTVFENML